MSSLEELLKNSYDNYPQVRLCNEILCIYIDDLDSENYRWSFIFNVGKEITMGDTQIEDLKAFRLEYLKTFNRPAPDVSKSEWIEILDYLAKNKSSVASEEEEEVEVKEIRSISFEEIGIIHLSEFEEEPEEKNV